MIKEGISVGYYQGDDSAIARLAEQGEVAAVDFLLNEFDADPYEAVKGYARGKHLVEMQKVLDSENDPFTHFELKLRAILGLGQGGNLDQAYRWIVNERDPINQHMLRKWFVQGLGKAGNTAEIDKQLNAEPIFSKQLQLKFEAAFGLGLSGHVDALTKMITDVCEQIPPLSSRIYEDLAKIIFKALGVNGHVVLIAELIATTKEFCDLDKSTFWSEAIYGLARGSFLKEMAELLAKHNECSNASIIRLLGQGGNFKEIRERIASTSNLDQKWTFKQAAAHGLAYQHHYQQMYQFLYEIRVKCTNKHYVSVVSSAALGLASNGCMKKIKVLIDEMAEISPQSYINFALTVCYSFGSRGGHTFDEFKKILTLPNWQVFILQINDNDRFYASFLSGLDLQYSYFETETLFFDRNNDISISMMLNYLRPCFNTISGLDQPSFYTKLMLIYNHDLQDELCRLIKIFCPMEQQLIKNILNDARKAQRKLLIRNLYQLSKEQAVIFCKQKPGEKYWLSQQGIFCRKEYADGRSVANENELPLLSPENFNLIFSFVIDASVRDTGVITHAANHRICQLTKGSTKDAQLRYARRMLQSPIDLICEYAQAKNTCAKGVK